MCWTTYGKNIATCQITGEENEIKNYPGNTVQIIHFCLFCRRVMRDAIPQDQSLKSLKFIKEKFGDGNLTASEAAQMLLVGLQVVDIDRMDGLVVAKVSLSDNLCCFFLFHSVELTQKYSLNSLRACLRIQRSWKMILYEKSLHLELVPGSIGGARSGLNALLASCWTYVSRLDISHRK